MVAEAAAWSPLGGCTCTPRSSLRAVDTSAKSTEKMPPSGRSCRWDGRPEKSPEATPRMTNLRVSSMSMSFMDWSAAVPDSAARPPESMSSMGSPPSPEGCAA